MRLFPPMWERQNPHRPRICAVLKCQGKSSVWEGRVVLSKLQKWLFSGYIYCYFGLADSKPLPLYPGSLTGCPCIDWNVAFKRLNMCLNGCKHTKGANRVKRRICYGACEVTEGFFKISSVREQYFSSTRPQKTICEPRPSQPGYQVSK